VPPDNPPTSARIELGRHLFYDTRLSGNGTQSCATCHRQELAFTDGRARAVGSTGEVHPRSAMSLANAAYMPALTWANPRLRSLEDQALVPMFGTRPVELGLAGREEDLAARLRGDARYVEMFRAAFPGERQPVRIANVTRALASFERTLISGDSPYDRLVYRDDESALSKQAWSGMRNFFSDRLACSECHGGFNFSGPVRFQGMERPADAAFHNTGVYDVESDGRIDTGLHALTGRKGDVGRFRAPTLRNIALTAPYMHDGSIATLGEVIDHYAAGGRAGGGKGLRSPLVRGFEITPEEKRDLIEFLGCLTDRGFTTDERFSDPWKPGAATEGSGKATGSVWGSAAESSRSPATLPRSRSRR
jgi:cytochrome c peroxidase